MGGVAERGARRGKCGGNVGWWEMECRARWHTPRSLYYGRRMRMLTREAEKLVGSLKVLTLGSGSMIQTNVIFTCTLETK